MLGVTFLPPAFENRDKICRPQMNGTSMYADEIMTRFVTYVVTLGLVKQLEKRDFNHFLFRLRVSQRFCAVT